MEEIMHSFTLSVARETFWGSLSFYATRYAFLAGIVFLLRGTPVLSIKCEPKSELFTLNQVLREIFTSLRTILIFSCVNALINGSSIGRHTLVYTDIHAYSYWWFVLSIPCLLVLYDTFFYWLHRLTHTPRLYRLIHMEHHLSVHATPFATFRFSCPEAALEAALVWGCWHS